MTEQPFVDRSNLALVAAFSAMFVAAIGIAPGEANHLVYLLPGLHAANPEFLAADWFVTRVQHPHVVFNALVATFARAGITELGLVIGTVVQSLVFALAVWAITRQLYSAPLIPWAMTLMLLGATGTHSVGLTLLIGPQLEASTIAGVATVIGLAFLASNRCRSWAGPAFGLAAMFHAHFAVLIVPVAAVAAVFTVRRDGWLRGLMIFVPVLVLGLPSFLQVLAHQFDPALEIANNLTLKRFPHHYDPRTWGFVQGSLFAGIVVAGGIGAVLRRPATRPVLFSAIALMAVMILVSLSIGYAGLSQTAMLLAPWRLGSIVIVFAILAASAVAPEISALRGRSRRFAHGAITLSAVPILVATVAGPIPARVGLAAGTALLVALWSGRRSTAAGGPGPRANDHVAIALVALGFLPGVWHGLERSHLSVGPATLEHPAVYRWVEANTDPNAVFAVPPGWIDFRLVTGRSIVADHKSPPTRPSELLQWAQRIEALTDRVPGGEAAELDSAFLAGDCVRILGLRDGFGVRFAVRRAGSPLCGHAVYTDRSFSIVDVTKVP